MKDCMKKIFTFTACTIVAGCAIGILFPEHIIKIKIEHDIPYEIRTRNNINHDIPNGVYIR